MPSFKFHFLEIDLIIYLPSHGNEGRSYSKYGVTYLDRKRGRSQSGRIVVLKEALSRPEIKKGYPHTVGFYLSSKGRGQSWKPDYLRKKKVSGPRSFYNFLKTLSL